ncbi:MAG: hypothetical protein DRO00_06880 [Thermoproteota archaeon]|nr:MAG: hypothetical protein DRO00_06880 [Candidatus Korarchaeota archaeon]
MIEMRKPFIPLSFLKINIGAKRDFLIGFAVALILLGAGGFWDLAVIKQDWELYPLPFELVLLPRYIAGDLFFLLIVVGMFILLWVRTK